MALCNFMFFYPLMLNAQRVEIPESSKDDMGCEYPHFPDITLVCLLTTPCSRSFKVKAPVFLLR